jgi:signal transduction histidine kinase
MADPSPTPEKPAASSAPAVPWERVERFVGQLTHDVRNGLNALELQLTFLGEISTDPEAVEEVRRLRRTLGDVTRQLQVMKTATGKAFPQLLNYPAADLFEDLRERFERQNPAAGNKVSWEIETGDALLTVDPELTINALLELLTNALHFGEESGEVVRFSARVDGGAARMAVVTLSEPKPASAPPILTENWGLEPLRSAKRSGYGLGLFRARRIIEAQGGALAAGFSLPGCVLTTTINLPLAAEGAV